MVEASVQVRFFIKKIDCPDCSGEESEPEEITVPSTCGCDECVCQCKNCTCNPCHCERKIFEHDPAVVCVRVVGVSSIDYQSPVALGTTVSFKAIKNPAGNYNWPSGFPIWTCSTDDEPTSGTGEETEITFTSVSETRVECENTECTVTQDGEQCAQCEEVNVPHIVTARCGAISATGSTAIAEVVVVPNFVNISTLQHAKERLPGVVQVPGYFKISRDTIAPEDDWEAVIVSFNIVEVRTGGKLPKGKAELGADYGICWVNEPLAGATENFLSLSSNTETLQEPTDTLPAIVQTTFSGSVTIAADKEDVFIKVNPVWDWLDEGAEGEAGEFLTITLTNVNGHYDIDSDASSAEMEIKDGAVLRIRTDSNNDGILDESDCKEKEKVGHIGRLVVVNDDDDNNNNEADYHEKPLNDVPMNRTG